MIGCSPGSSYERSAENSGGMADRWQYLIEELSGTEESTERQLDSLGAAGWKQ